MRGNALTRSGKVSRLALGLGFALVLFIAFVGLIAWIVQYLPRGQVTPKGPDPISNDDKQMLEFPTTRAIWRTPESNKKDEDPDKTYPYKDFEHQSKGHYDFPFKNISDKDIEIVFYRSDCDCASVQACGVSKDEVERLIAAFKEKPGDPLPYTNDPGWVDLAREANKDKKVSVKAGEGGVIRVNFIAKKAPGQELRVMPGVIFQPAGDSNRRIQILGVPVMVRQPVQFYPPRLSMGVLNSGTKAEAKLVAWSGTRDKLDLQLPIDDPFFVVETKSLSPSECAELESTLRADKQPARVASAVEIKITAHESKDGKQLDQGSFYRKLPVKIDKFLQPDIPGPEIVGRVDGDIVIGGADDAGRIRFKAFDIDRGSTKVVELSVTDNVKLQTHDQQPDWVTVSLRLDEKNIPKGRRIWLLEVKVPPNTPQARSFDEPDAVVLRIVGASERFVRIPIEGHISAR